MAELKVVFHYRIDSGERELWIDYRGEEDLLPHEHEALHRAWVEKILGTWPDPEVQHIRITRGPRQWHYDLSDFKDSEGHMSRSYHKKEVSFKIIEKQ